MPRFRNVDDPVELAAVADGSLDHARWHAVASRLAAAPDLRVLLAEQERALGLVRAAAETVAAPAGLRARVEAKRVLRPARPARAFGFGVGVTAAAVTMLALLVLSPGPGGGPSAAAAVELSTLAATGRAPAPRPDDPKLLDRAVGDVAFPGWRRTFGWRAAGVRTDTLALRRTTTVFYEKRGHRLAYTIVDGSPLAVPRGAVEVHRGSHELYTFAAQGRRAVTWLRGGRTCVLSGSAVGRGVLLKLALWKGGGAVTP